MNNKVLANSNLLVLGTPALIITPLIGIGVVIAIETGLLEAETRADALSIEILFALLTFILTVLLIITILKKGCTIVDFSEKGLYILKPFRKKEFIPYSIIREVSMVTYNHTGWHPKLIAVSKRKLSKYEKNHANEINDKDIIVFNYRRKVIGLLEKNRLHISK